jgi:hypothetical protein
MRLFIVLIAIGLFFVILPQSQAQMPGNVGREVCGAEQVRIQGIVGEKYSYRNHGQLVKAAVHAVISARKDKQITVKCAACIFIEFALGIPIDEQKSCGPVFDTEACDLLDDRCEDMSAEDCIDAEGDPQGTGTDCASVTSSGIETVACCLIGNICEDLTLEDCNAERGVPGVFGSQCSPFYCVSPN